MWSLKLLDSAMSTSQGIVAWYLIRKDPIETWHNQCSWLVLTGVMNVEGPTSCWKPLNYGIIWSDLLKWTSFRCLPKQITVISSFTGPPVLCWQPISWLHALLFPVPWVRTKQWSVSVGLSAEKLQTVQFWEVKQVKSNHGWVHLKNSPYITIQSFWHNRLC